MKTSRRKMLSILAGVPIAGPLAAKLAGDQEAATLIGMSLSQAPVLQTFEGTSMPPPNGTGPVTPTETQRKLAMKLPWVKNTLREIIREGYGPVNGLDPDIANKRSWSLAAKVTFQRQRNIERSLESIGRDYPYDRISRVWRDWMKGLVQ